MGALRMHQCNVCRPFLIPISLPSPPPLSLFPPPWLGTPYYPAREGLNYVVGHIVECLASYSSDPDRVVAVLVGLVEGYRMQHIFGEDLEVQYSVQFTVGKGEGRFLYSNNTRLLIQ